MKKDTRLDYLLTYHRNLCELIKAMHESGRQPKDYVWEKLESLEKEIDGSIGLTVKETVPFTPAVEEVVGDEPCTCGNPSGRRFPKMVDGQFSSEFYCKDCNKKVNI